MTRYMVGVVTMLIVAVIASGIALVPSPTASAAPAIQMTVSPATATIGAGDAATFQVSWSCSSVTDNCENMQLVVRVPNGQPDSTRVIIDTASASSGGFTAAPIIDRTNNTITWNFITPVTAGSSGQMTFSIIPENFRTPDGETITPVATLTADDVEPVVRESTLTVNASTALGAVKVLANPNVVPALDQPVTYTVNAAPERAMQANGSPTFDCGAGVPTLNLMNIVLTDQLPVGAEFVSASDGGVYDSATHSVTWPPRNESNITRATGDDQCGAWPTPYSITLRYPSTVFTPDDSVVNNISATAHSVLRTDDTYSASDSVSHSFAETVGAGSIAKRGTYPGYTVWRGLDYAGQGGTHYLLSYSNRGNIPLELSAVDVLPCAFASPLDAGSTDCSTPALQNVYLQLSGSNPADTLTVNYTTNLGNTGSALLTTSMQRPVTSTTEWITKIEVTGTIAPGSVGSIKVGGRINPDLPHTSPDDTPYRRPGLYTGPDGPAQNLFIENCVDSMTLSAGGSVITQVNENSDVGTRCGYMQVRADSAQVQPTKRISNSVQPIDGEMTVSLVMSPRFGSAPLNPIFTDLLPVDLRYVEGQTPRQVFGGTDTPYTAVDLLDPAALVTEVIDDYMGTGRQLVRFSWPGEVGISSGDRPVEVKFEVAVQPGAPIGTRQNTILAFDANHPQGEDSINNCTYAARVVDELDQAGDDAHYWGCANNAPYTVIATGAITADKLVRGSEDADYTGYPAQGRVVPGEPASYRVDVTNTGNVDLTGVVSYDILPHPGDTGVGPAGSQPRDSEWATILVGPVSVPDAPDAVVMYSTSDNPCRGEVFEAGAARTDGPDGCVDDWSTDLPSNLADVTAIRVDYGELVFAPGDVVPYVIDVEAPERASGTAWNSVALAGQRADTAEWLLPVEPRKVGLETPWSLKFTSTFGVECLEPGATVSFVAQATNEGPSDMTNVGLVALLDSQFGSPTDAGDGVYDAITGDWSLDRIDAGTTATRTFEVVVPDGAVEGDEFTFDLSFETADGWTVVPPSALSAIADVCVPPPTTTPSSSTPTTTPSSSSPTTGPSMTSVPTTPPSSSTSAPGVPVVTDPDVWSSTTTPVARRPLPRTGASAADVVLLAALACSLGGLALIAARRRQSL